MPFSIRLTTLLHILNTLITPTTAFWLIPKTQKPNSHKEKLALLFLHITLSIGVNKVLKN
jgi:hypothetical protein